MPHLKILLVCENIPAPMLGGLAKHVVALGNALMDGGHEVSLMGRDQPAYADCIDEVGFRGRFIAGFPSTVKGWKEQQLGIFNPWKRPYLARQIARAIQARAVDFDVVHYHGHLPMVGRYLPQSINFLQTRHDQGSECITHLRFRDGAVCTALAPQACAGCVHPSPGPLRTAISAAAVRRYRRESADAFGRHPVVFVSDALRNNFIRAMPDAPMGLSAVVHNFVDEAELRRLARPVAPGMVPGQVRVHVAGRLDAAKGIGPLLDLLVPRLPESWSVHVYGDGPLRERLQQSHEHPNLQWHGHRPYAETVAAGSQASVVVVPSLLEESCGTVVLEALRLGKPCYAMRRGGTPELQRYGSAGQLRLFDNLPVLVDALLADALLCDAAGGESADVHVRLPDLLMLYRRHMAPHPAGAA